MKKDDQRLAPSSNLPVLKTVETGRASAFTLVELLVVIAIIGVLAGLIVGLSGFAGRKMRESRIRSELNQLITAIEAYQSKFGHYPPDSVVPGTTVPNPATNQLYYELTGTVVDNVAKTFRTPNRQATLPGAAVQAYFGAEGFVNSSADPKQVKSFMSFRVSQYQELGSSPNVELLVVPVPWPLSDFDQPTSKRGLNPWRYVSRNPTNNPTTYDLWAEYKDGRKVKVICNWSKDILERP